MTSFFTQEKCRKALRFCFFLVVGFLFSGCDKKDPIITGHRIAVLSQTDNHFDTQMPGIFSLEKTVFADSWLAANGNAHNALPVFRLKKLTKSTQDSRGRAPEALRFRPLWNYKLSENRAAYLFMPPVAQKEKLFFLGGDDCVHAVSLPLGKRLWKSQATGRNPNKLFSLGGGVCLHKEAVYVTSGVGLTALSKKTGHVLWAKTLENFLRAPPVVNAAGFLYALNTQNQIEGFEPDTNKSVADNSAWIHFGMPQVLQVMGASVPVMHQSDVGVCYSSGEVLRLSGKTGRVVWSFQMPTAKRDQNDLEHITASPVFKDGFLYVTSSSGGTAMLDWRNGQPRWSVGLGGGQTPLVLGDSVFLIDKDGVLTRMNKKNGHVFWRAMLGAHGEEKQKKNVRWFGPLMIEGNLYVLNSQGVLCCFEPSLGTFLGQVLKADMPCSMAPILVKDCLVILGKNGTLKAFRAKSAYDSLS